MFYWITDFLNLKILSLTSIKIFKQHRLDLPHVDHGGRSARPERRSREWSTCVACRNLNRIKNFGANNFDIKRVCTFHTITSPRRQWVYKNTKTFSRIDISLSSNETVCTKCGIEITDPSKRRKLFNVSTTTSACKNLLNLDSCLSNNVCRNCVDKNSNLLDLL
jgi:hypothetical protein